jgi:2-polyprenyl-6-methoxyphenol hydroxylase-like FAD-dependent oxidoreductase
MQHTSWLDKLAGEEYGRVWAWGNKPSEKGQYEMASPCVMSDLPQSVLEPILVDEATRAGAEVRFSTEFVDLRQDEEGVTTTLCDRETKNKYEVRSKYVIGADGARSPVLTALGISVTGKQINTAYNVHIKADLTKYIVHRPGSLNWVLNTEAPEWSAVGNFRMVRPWTEFVVSMHPANKDMSTFDPPREAVLKRLYQMIGDDTVPIEILSTFSWTINDQVADSYQRGRVLCIGDAVHRHPPINGLGSNTCISDAFNLAWKLAYVLQGRASPRLLDTLTTERKPVGDGVVRRANQGMEYHRQIWALLGLDDESRQRNVTTLKSATAEGACRREQLRNAFAATDLEVQALGIQMNQRYCGSPAVVVEEGDAQPDLRGADLVKELIVSTFPGYHLPHVWLAAGGQAERVSNLDLCGKGGFTLFTGIGGAEWLDAANAAAEHHRIPVRGYSLGFGCDYTDCYQDWAKVRGVDEDGVVLVRPDHFVAWRCKALVSAAATRLISVIAQILGTSK